MGADANRNDLLQALNSELKERPLKPPQQGQRQQVQQNAPPVAVPDADLLDLDAHDGDLLAHVRVLEMLCDCC